VLFSLRRLQWLELFVIAIFSLAIAVPTVPAHAARHALLVGVGKYDKEKGIEPLVASVNDAEALEKILSQRGINFRTEVLRDDDVRDKAAFDAALATFLSKVKPGDQVVFYFSGHGYNIPGRGNFFLLGNAKSQTIHLKDLGAATARSLDTQDKRDRSYQDWLGAVALSEAAIQTAIEERKAEVIVIIADACRNFVSGTKGASIATANGISLPKATSRGVFRLYSASVGQISLDAPERQSLAPKSQKDSKPSKEAPKPTSLFTRVLLNEVPVPGLDINVLAAKVKVEVRDQARKQGADQIPDFVDDRDATRFSFVEDSSGSDIAARCQTAKTELAQLRYGVAHGAIGRETIERKRFELAPCGMADEISGLLRLEAQGAGALSAPQTQIATVPESNDPVQQCEVLASSPLDPNRPQGIAGFEIQKVALAAASGEIEQDRAVAFIEHAIKACEIAVKERNRVARYKFNLARSYYAMATIAKAADFAGLLEKASRHYGEAVDLGYAAAYNSLGQLYQNGEVHVLKADAPIRISADRDMAVKLFTRGAELNDMLANYNLGMAYKNGESGVKPDQSKAFPYFSKAAEAGFVPAMIETGLALRWGRGVSRNGKRAVELLEIAASRGSSEAMFWLGDIYQKDFIDTGLEYTRDIVVIDFNEAIVWYARAADAGDTRSQERLAEMLSKGEGLPAAQPEAAGRYWRLAAEGGSLEAQMQLANLIRDGRVPFRPKVGGAPDAGAHEIHSLYASAFARGKTKAGLELAKLYRYGFPRNRGSEAIPQDHQKAILLLWDVMDRARSAPGDSDDANPEHEVWAAFELISMYDAGESKRRDGTSVIMEDQIAQLRADYGDPSQYRYIRTGAVALGGINCPRGPNEFWVMVWNWKRAEPPTEQMFDWFERRYKCKDIVPGDTRSKTENLGVLKRTRDVFRREFEAAQKDKSGTRTFVDRMVELVRTDTTKKQR
jgi:TPR repeat protein